MCSDRIKHLFFKKLMEAIILAGGAGTRLREVVPHLPKPMAPVAGKPFLEILLSNLCRAGFTRVVISLGYMASHISDYFGNKYRHIDISYVVEDVPLGTGGALRLAMTSCTCKYVYVFNGDTYLDLEFDKVERQWRARNRTIVVGKCMANPTRYGILSIRDQRVSDFRLKPEAGSCIINAGCYVLKVGALDSFPLGTSFSMEDEFLLPEARRGAVDVFITEGEFIDIGIPSDYALAQAMLAGNL